MTSPAREQLRQEPGEVCEYGRLYCHWRDRAVPTLQAELVRLRQALTAAVQAERRRIIALAREYGTESTTALADQLAGEDA